MQKHSISSILAASLLAAVNCTAQADTNGHVSIGRAELTEWNGLRDIIPHLKRDKLRAVMGDTWEGKNIEATLQAASVAFSINLGDPSGFYTDQTPAGDVLVAEWPNIDPSRPYRAVWLWDDPRQINLIFVSEPGLLQPGSLTPLCEKTIRWQDDGGIVKSLQLQFPASGGVVGKGIYPTNEIGALAWWLTAQSVKGIAYLDIGMTKAFFASKYPLGTMGVPERFPPLSLRLKTVGREELFDELGKGYQPPRLITYPGRRDEIVLRELASRGTLSEAEVSRVVLGPDSPAMRRIDTTSDIRLQALLAALYAGGQLKQHIPVLQSFFLSPRAKGLSERHAATFLGQLHHAGVDSTGTALRLLQREEYARACLFELKMEGHDLQTLKALSEAPVPARLQSDKNAATEAIRSRLGISRQ